MKLYLRTKFFSHLRVIPCQMSKWITPSVLYFNEIWHTQDVTEKKFFFKIPITFGVMITKKCHFYSLRFNEHA